MVAPLLKTAARQVITRQAPARRRQNRTRMYLLAIGAAGLVVAFAATLLLAAAATLFTPFSSGEDPMADCQPGLGGAGVTGAGAITMGQLSSEQIENAKTIIEVSKSVEAGSYGSVVALATALQESTLRNLSWGDRDSVGLFQQRAAWGPRDVRMDPAQSSNLFFNGGMQGQPGLLDIDGWREMPVTIAAQSVQRSAFPQAYADDEPLARALVARFGDGSLPGECGLPPGAQCPETPWDNLESGLTPDALIVLRCTHEKWPQFETFHGVGERPAGGDGDHANGRAVDMMIPYSDYQSSEAKDYGWQVTKWLQDNRKRFGIKYLIYDKKIWSVARSDEGWREYDHYAGCSSDTCLHYDHIHASVYGDAAALPSTGDWALPVPPGSYTLTARFGECGGNWENCHTGLDFAAGTGTTVRAAGDGTVIAAAHSTGPYGNYVKVDHGQGIVTMYAHLYDFPPGLVGEQVRAGMRIGEVGATGNTTGPHLHFELRQRGVPTDPEAWLERHGLDP